MTTINKKWENKAFKAPSIQLFSEASLAIAPKHRNIFTAKVRPRTLLSSGRGSRQEPRGSALNNEYYPQVQENSNEQIEGVLHQFDNLQLEDFLKVVIVGKSKLSETKSKEIIRSLNGTWFKNTESQSPLNRLYCSLPIRRQKNASTAKRGEGQGTRKSSLSDYFFNNYTPPNLFPKRKVSPMVNRSAYIKLEHTQSNRLDFQDEIKSKIVQKLPAYNRENSHEKRRKKRPSSYFANGKQSSALKFFEEGNGCLVGKKMLIHD